jgi:hypothetical protein
VFARHSSEAMIVRVGAAGSASSPADLPTLTHTLPELWLAW